MQYKNVWTRRLPDVHDAERMSCGDLGAAPSAHQLVDRDCGQRIKTAQCSGELSVAGHVPIVSEFADGGGAVDEFDGALSGEVLPASELDDDIGDEFTCGVCV